MARLTRVRIAVYVAATLVLLAGCASSPETPSDAAQQHSPADESPTVGPPAGEGTGATEPTSFVRFDEFLREYQRASSELSSSLPQGASLPPTPPGAWEEDGEFEVGAGEMQAAFAWQCTWLVELDVVEDESRWDGAEVAIRRLSGWVDLPQVDPHLDAASRDLWTSGFIEPARQGDTAALLSLLDGC